MANNEARMKMSRQGPSHAHGTCPRGEKSAEGHVGLTRGCLRHRNPRDRKSVSQKEATLLCDLITEPPSIALGEFCRSGAGCRANPNGGGVPRV